MEEGSKEEKEGKKEEEEEIGEESEGLSLRVMFVSRLHTTVYMVQVSTYCSVFRPLSSGEIDLHNLESDAFVHYPSPQSDPSLLEGKGSSVLHTHVYA